MSFTYDWDTAFEALPAGTDQVKTVDNRIQEYKNAVRERLNTDHEFSDKAESAPSAAQVTAKDSGYHRKVTFVDPTTEPSAIANAVVVGSRDDKLVAITPAGERYPFLGESPWKIPIDFASTTNGTFATAFANGQTVDGVALVTGDTILLKDQTSGAENGLYRVTTGSPVRLEAYNTAESLRGAVCYIREGTANAGRYFKLTNTGTITVDTTALTFEDALAPVGARNEGLVIIRPTNSTIDIDIRKLAVYNTSDRVKVLTTVNLTLDITVSGILGMDTGAEANSVWYYLWVIAKEDGTVSGIFSLQPPSGSSPTMPTGYTYKACVGSCYNNSSGNILDFHKLGDVTTFVSNIAELTTGTDLSFAEVDIASSVPVTATSAMLLLDMNESGVTADCQISNPSGSCIQWFQVTSSGATAHMTTAIIPLHTAQKIWYLVSAGYVNISTIGYIENFNCGL